MNVLKPGRLALLSLLAAIVSLLIAGCSADGLAPPTSTTGNNPPPTPTTFNVTGTFVDSITGAALSGWTVTLTGTAAAPPNGNGGLTVSATTASNGTVNITASGSLTGPATITVYNGATIGYGPVAVTLPAAGGTLALGQISVNSNGLPPAPPA